MKPMWVLGLVPCVLGLLRAGCFYVVSDRTIHVSLHGRHKPVKGFQAWPHGCLQPVSYQKRLTGEHGARTRHCPRSCAETAFHSLLPSNPGDSGERLPVTALTAAQGGSHVLHTQTWPGHGPEEPKGGAGSSAERMM